MLSKGNHCASSRGFFRALRLLRRSASRCSASLDVSRTPRRLIKILLDGINRPIFIIGAPRSGTSFLGRCIAQLPNVAYFHEPEATKLVISQFGDDEWPEWLVARYHTFAYSLLLWSRASGYPRFAEKTPRNCFFIRFLKDRFPRAVFIHIIRDGRDVAFSLSKKPWLSATKDDSGKREPGGYRYGPYPRFWVERERREEFRQTSDIHRCAWSWRRHVESALAASNSLSASDYFELRYEDLCTRPVQVGRQISHFLGISVDYESQYYQKLENASARSIGNHQGKLTSTQIDEIEREAHSVLKRLSYL